MEQLKFHQYDVTEWKLANFKDKLRITAKQLSDKDKQLKFAKKMSTTAETSCSPAHVYGNQQGTPYVQNLKSKQAGLETDKLRAKCIKYKCQAKLLAEQCLEFEARSVFAEEMAFEAQKQIKTLARALGLAEREGMDLGAIRGNPPKDFSEGIGRFLVSLAQSQEEAGSLAVQVAELGRMLAQAEEELGRSRTAADMTHGEKSFALEKEAQAREEAEAAKRSAAEHAHEAGERAGQLAQLQAENQQLTSKFVSAESRTEDIARKLRAATFRAQRAEEQLADLDRSSRSAIESLRDEVGHALRHANTELAGMRSEASAREFKAGEAARHITAEMGELQAQLSEQQQQLSAAAMREKELVAELERFRSSVKDLNRELVKTQAALQAQQVARQDLANDLEDGKMRTRGLERETVELKEQLKHAQNRLVELQSQMQQCAKDQRLNEERWSEQMSGLAEQLDSAKADKDRLLTKMKAYEEEALDAQTESRRLRQHNQDLSAAVDSLTQSQGKLQSGMLKQLELFRVKLKEAQDLNMRLTSQLGAVT